MLASELDTGTSLGGAANNWHPTWGRMKKYPKTHEEQPDAVKSERHGEEKKSTTESRSGKNYLFSNFVINFVLCKRRRFILSRKTL